MVHDDDTSISASSHTSVAIFYLLKVMSIFALQTPGLLLIGYELYGNLISDKIEWNFFQAVAVSILLNGCTTGMLMKSIQKKLDGNYTKMLCAVSNKSWKQHSTKQQLYGHQPLILQTIQVR